METSTSAVAGLSLSIPVVGAVGRAPTALAAFDDALGVAGVQNFNLVRLSSVIPPGSRVVGATASPVADRPHQIGEPTSIDLRSGRAARAAVPQGRWGDRLYAVWAAASAHHLGEEAWAGVAWVQDPVDGRGLFVEHEGGSEHQVREELAASLNHISGTRGMGGLAHRSVVVGARCDGQPVTSLVIAPYLAEPWGGARQRPA